MTRSRLNPLLFALSALLLLAPAFYWGRVLLPRVLAESPGRMTSNVYPAWRATREALLRRQNPYSDEVTREIQAGYYGHVLGPEEHRDQERFAYPATLILLLAPMAWLPFPAVRVVTAVASALVLAACAPLWSRTMGFPTSRRSDLWAAALTLGSWPAALALGTQQPTVLVFGAITLACYLALRRQAFALAGFTLSLATVKPQLSWCFIAVMLVWSLRRAERRALAYTFVACTSALALAANLLLPGWLGQWLTVLPHYMQYTDSRLPLEALLGAHLGRPLTAFAVLAAMLPLVRLRSLEWSAVFALIAAVTLLCMPTAPWNTYNQLIAIPVALHLVRGVAPLPARIVGLLALAWGNFGCVLALAASFAVPHLPGVILSAPVYLFSVLPLVLLAAVVPLPVLFEEKTGRELATAVG